MRYEIQSNFQLKSIQFNNPLKSDWKWNRNRWEMRNWPLNRMKLSSKWTDFILFVDLVGAGGGGGGGGGSSGGGSGVLLGGQVERFRLRGLRGASGRRRGRRLRGQEPGGRRHGRRHITAHIAQTVVNIPQVDAGHIQRRQGVVRRLAGWRIRS